MLTDTSPETVIACTPQAIPAQEREHWIAAAKAVYAAVEEVRDLPDGFALRLPNDAATLVKTADYVSLDRLCCAFIRWSLVVEPNRGPSWLHLTGVEGTKDYLKHNFETTPLLPEAVAEAAGFSLANRRPWVHPDDPTLGLS